MKHTEIKQISKRKYLEVEIRTERDYFSITGTTYEKLTRGYKYNDYKEFNGKKFECCECGCIHDIILKHYPKFKMFIDLHLSDIKGIPHHFTSNGFYFIDQFLQRKDYNLKTIQNHFRIDRNEAKKLCRIFVKEGKVYAQDYVFNNYISRYNKEGKEALKVLTNLIKKN